MGRSVTEITLAHPVEAAPTAADFTLIQRDLPDTPPQGMLHVRVLWLGLDPYLGPRIRGRHMGEPRPVPGGPLPGEGVCQVLASAVEGFEPGDYVVTEAGWAEEAMVSAETVRRIDPSLGLTAHLGLLGMPGVTAWAGITQLAKVQAGDVLCINAAAGVVAGTAGQIAKAAGARVIGIAGGPDKCRLALEQYGFDACVDYRQEGWQQQLADLSKEAGGFSIHFENVGASMLQVALPLLRPYARVVLCGLAEHYGAGTPAMINAGMIMFKRATVHGLIVYDFIPRRAEWVEMARPLIASGALREANDVAVGLQAAPAQLEKVVRGQSNGRALVRVAGDAV